MDENLDEMYTVHVVKEGLNVFAYAYFKDMLAPTFKACFSDPLTMTSTFSSI